MISKVSARQRVKYAAKYGFRAAMEKFHVTIGTLKRYKRLIDDAPGEIIDLPRILVFDIETAPMEVYVWGLYKQRISHENVISDWFILSWSAKWLFSKEVKADVLTPEEAVRGDDSRICKSIWHLFESADIVIAHNAFRFDIRRLNARWMLNRLTPPSPYQVIDTLKHAQKMAFLASHKLDFLSRLFFNKQKIETNYDLWKRCKRGDPEALEYMVQYNRKDVKLLEEVYLYIRPWIRPHPTTGLFIEGNEPVCATCGSDKLVPTDPYVTSAGIYPGFRCKKCGAISRGRFTRVPLARKKKFLVSTAK